jgi:hypothetical protein
MIDEVGTSMTASSWLSVSAWVGRSTSLILRTDSCTRGDLSAWWPFSALAQQSRHVVPCVTGGLSLAPEISVPRQAKLPKTSFFMIYDSRCRCHKASPAQQARRATSAPKPPSPVGGARSRTFDVNLGASARGSRTRRLRPRRPRTLRFFSYGDCMLIL